MCHRTKLLKIARHIAEHVLHATTHKALTLSFRQSGGGGGTGGRKRPNCDNLNAFIVELEPRSIIK